MPAAIVIPACLEPLTDERRWLVWRREQSCGGRLTKVPYRADHPLSRASCNDPATWCSFETAMQAYLGGGFDGIAFALMGSNIAAFDVDHCRDAASGALHAWAQQLVARCGSYVEITPSSEGIRILGTGSDRKIHRKFVIADGVNVEVYRNCERFITVTGDQILPSLDQLVDIDAIADQVVGELDAAKKAKQPVSCVPSSRTGAIRRNYQEWMWHELRRRQKPRCLVCHPRASRAGTYNRRNHCGADRSQ